MKKLPKISPAEWHVMKTAWAQSPILAHEVIEKVGKAHKWHPKTVRTLLARLVTKRALSYQKQGRAFAYSPMVSESDCIDSECDSFLERIFDGSSVAMLARFIGRKKISGAQLRELKRLLHIR